MYSSDKVVQVGAPDPELKNSPIEQEADEELDTEEIERSKEGN